MTTRLLPIATCGDCAYIVRTWEGASTIFVCGRLRGRTICSWMTPRPPIPEWCPLEEATSADDGDRAGLTVQTADLLWLRDD